jgi:glutathione S-transferase
MKFYTSVGPNPRVVKLFMAEKGITLPEVEVDLRGGENRRPPYSTEVNPSGQTPALELDDGSFVTEITAICEYLDERFPENSLLGDTAEERAKTRMWTRRVDLKFCEPMANGFRFAEGLPLFEPRMRCLPDAAPGLKAIAQDGLAWLDEQLGERPFLAGNKLTLADVLLFAFVEFGNAIGQPLSAEYANINRWFAAMQARPSATAA